MPDVTRIIASLVVLSVLSGCGNDTPRSKPDYSILQQKIDIPIRGKVTCITTQAFADSINNGANLQLIFIQEFAPENPADNLALPGMNTILLGETYNYVKKLNKNQPLYLLCLYGDDSKRMGNELSKDGWNSFYLDGGSYRLKQDIKQGKVKVNSLRS